MNFKGISLFTGCGGMDLGFVQEGFSFAYGLEEDAHAVETYNCNNRSSIKQRKITPATTIDKGLDIVIAGPPCQGFSTAGGYQKIDPRNELLITACDIATKARPKVIVLENVSGLTNKINNPTLEKAVGILREANYFVDMRVIECEKFGVPQRRRRLFVVARNKNREFSLSRILTKPNIVLKDVLTNIDEYDPYQKIEMIKKGSKDWQIELVLKNCTVC